MEQIIVVGDGGHARVVIEILEESREFQIAGCTSAVRGNTEVLGIPVLGDDSILPRLYESGLRRAFIALGDNRARLNKTRELAEMGFMLVNAISTHAAVSRRAVLGCGVAVMPGAVVNVLSRVGNGAIVNTGAIVDHDCQLGAFCHVGPGSSLAGRVSVAEGAFLGTGVHVIPGVSIGAWAIVGAGAAVVRDVPASVTAAGVPAAIIKDFKGRYR